MAKHFDLDKVKVYLDGVLSGEEYIKTYKDCADDVYRVFSYKKEVSLKDVEQWLRGLPIGTAYITVETEKLAFGFCKSLRKLTNDGRRSADDCYWWALATGIWVYGGMTKENPKYRG